jgi:hypothetical protein
MDGAEEMAYERQEQEKEDKETLCLLRTKVVVYHDLLEWALNSLNDDDNNEELCTAIRIALGKKP